MIKKIIMLLTLVFILCGCTARVDIKIDKTSIDETISIVDYANENYDKEQVLAKYKKWMPIDKSVVIVDTESDEAKSGINYYKRKVNDLGNGYNILYNYNYAFDEYLNSRSLNTAFKSSFVSYSKKDSTITISTDSAGTNLFNQYKDLDSLLINLESNYEVIDSNADSVNGNVSTWNLSRDNNQKIYIQYKVPKNNSQSGQSPELEENNSPTGEKEEKTEFPLIFGVLCVILGIFVFFVLVLVVNNIERKKYK